MELYAIDNEGRWYGPGVQTLLRTFRFGTPIFLQITDTKRVVAVGTKMGTHPNEELRILHIKPGVVHFDSSITVTLTDEQMSNLGFQQGLRAGETTLSEAEGYRRLIPYL